MTLRIIFFAIMAALTVSTASAADRKYLVGSFDDIVIDGDMQIILTTGKSPSGRASGDVTMLDALRLVRVGKVLTVRLQNPAQNDRSEPINEPLVIHLTNRHVRNITLRGNAKLQVDRIEQPYGSTILLNGGGEISVGELIADKFSTTMYGNGKLEILGGTVGNSQVEIRGSAQYLAERLSSENLDLTQNGNANSIATVSDKSSIFNDGSGQITILGKGLCSIRQAGMARIICNRAK